MSAEKSKIYNWNRFMRLYLQSHLHIGLSVLSLIALTYWQLESIFNIWMGLLGFATTIVAYFFIKYPNILIDAIFEFKNSSTPLLIWILTFAVFSVICLLQLSMHVSIYLIPGFFMVLFYTLPLKDTGSNWRTHSGLKIFVVALAWTWMSVLIPLVEQKHLWNLSSLSMLLQRFFWILALAIPFEIRDLKTDSKVLNTIPQTLGIRGSKAFGTACMILFGILYYIEKEHLSMQNLFYLSAVELLTLSFLWGTTPNRSLYYTAFWTEAVPIFVLIGLEIYILIN